MADAAGGAGGGPGGAPGLKASSKHWLPVESNPPVMNAFLKKMGWPTELLRFCDVLSTEDWALSMLAPPVKAIMLLYPIKAAAEEHRREQAARIEAEGQVSLPQLLAASASAKMLASLGAPTASLPAMDLYAATGCRQWIPRFSTRARTSTTRAAPSR